jgi:GT2 family glycosyltransferase
MRKLVISNPSNHAPEFSIIVVPRFFPNRQLEEFIQSTGHVKTDYEVIVVTSTKHSSQSNREDLRGILDANTRCCRATIIALNEDPGLAQARNIGAAAAQSSNLIFSDDDIILTQDITPLIDKLDSGIQSIQPLLLRYADPTVVDSAGDRIIRLNGVYHASIRGAGQKLNQLGYRLIAEQLPSLRGAFFAVKKDALVDVGGFDGSLGFNFDDVDLGWRLTLAGFRNVFAPDVRVLHRGGRTTNVEASDRRAQRFHLVNHHAIQLKVLGVGAWLFVFARFEMFALRHSLLGRSGFFKEYVDVNRMLIQRLSAVNSHRRILRRHRYAGRKTFQAMANQQRFPIA